MRIGFLQFAPIFGNKEKNLELLVNTLKKTNPLPEVLVLPELAFTGYTFINKKEAVLLSEEIPGELSNGLLDISKKHNIAISAGFLERNGKNIFNSALFITPQGILDIYRKVHLFYNEKDIFEPGKNLNIFEYKGVKFGQLVCFDWLFPEAMRTLTLKGAQVILHLSNLVLPYCQDAMITRSIENRVFIVTANRIGNEKHGKMEYRFTGESQIVGPGGKRLLKVGRDTVGIFSIDIIPEEANAKWINEKNNIITDRRPEVYKL